MSPPMHESFGYVRELPMSRVSRRLGPEDHVINNQDPLMTVPEVAEYLSTSDRFVRRLVAERRIPFVKVGRHVRIHLSAVDAFLAAGSVDSVRAVR